MFKKFMVLFLSCILFFSTSTDCLGVSNANKEGNIPIEITYANGAKKVETSLDVISLNGFVFANAEQLGQLLGYDEVVCSESSLVFANKKDLRVLCMYYDSVNVDKLMGKGGFIKYTSPIEPKYIDERGWVPLEFITLLSDYSLIENNGRLCFEENDMNILTAMSNGTEVKDNFLFTHEREFGYSDGQLNFMYGDAHLCNLFNGILTMDGNSWGQLILQFVGSNEMYDLKYGNKLVKLFLTNSTDELDEATKNIKKSYELLSSEGGLSSYLDLEVKEADAKFADLLKTYFDKEGHFIKNNLNAANYNLAHRKTKKASKKLKNFLETKKLVNDIQKKLPYKIIDKGKYVEDAVSLFSYWYEFSTSNEFALEAMQNYYNNISNKSIMPKMTIDTFTVQTETLKNGLASYGAYNLFIDHWDDFISGVTFLLKSKRLIAWDLAANLIPIIKTGLEANDKFELSIYGRAFEYSAAYEWEKSYAEVIANGKIDENRLYSLAQQYYTFLKSCYITRDAALGSLEPVKNQSGIKELIKEQKNKNKKIAKYMAIMKQALDDKDINGNGAFGFLPSDNQKYLKGCDDEKITSLISEAKSKEELIELVEQKSKNKVISYQYLDMDHDGNEELVAAVNGEMNFVSLWFCSSDGSICERQSNITRCNSIDLIPLKHDKETHIAANFIKDGLIYASCEVFGLCNNTLRKIFGDEYRTINIDHDTISLNGTYLGLSKEKIGVIGRVGSTEYYYYDDKYVKYERKKITKKEFEVKDGAHNELYHFIKKLREEAEKSYPGEKYKLKFKFYERTDDILQILGTIIFKNQEAYEIYYNDKLYYNNNLLVDTSIEGGHDGY